MTSKTKAVLVAENEALRTEIEQLRADREKASAWMASAAEEIKALRATQHVAAPASSRPDTSARLAAMQAAKRQAMETGRTVKV